MLISADTGVPFKPAEVRRSELICDVCSFLNLIFAKITDRARAEQNRVTNKGTCLKVRVKVEVVKALASIPEATHNAAGTVTAAKVAAGIDAILVFDEAVSRR